MYRKNITIITGTGGALGTGHFQRMCYLADSLNSTGNFSVSLCITEGSPDVPESLKEIMADTIPPGTELIIRDMRDSSEEDINFLRKKAAVLVIDDTGPGRNVADHIIDLLPNPVNRSVPEKMFLFGYNFISEIKSMKAEVIAKDIDVAIYAGYKPDPDVVEGIRGSIPPGASAVLFSYGRPSLIAGEKIHVDTSYTDLLLRSRILITHFGITMYEGDLAGCRILTVNPTDYHSRLTAMITGKINVIQAGEYGNIDHKFIYGEIARVRKTSGFQIISKGSIRERININFEYFLRMFNNIISRG
ncbi:MAG TPA: hypothetical protein PK986_00235 [Spirochaetota bacterium]|nr:hypothetical protein [Spirochaetota bacterium]HQO38873.1 hypothetical protein [Spirochaetota bacterium]